MIQPIEFACKACGRVGSPHAFETAAYLCHGWLWIETICCVCNDWARWLGVVRYR